jgi:hypothetical protein
MTAASSYPIDDEPHGPPWPQLPPARFAIGDRVVSSWGDATVIRVFDGGLNARRSYLIKHDWSNAPAGFGHCFGEHELEPGCARPPIEGDAVQQDLFAEASA